jgi:heterodisulfide reductase subunit A2
LTRWAAEQPNVVVAREYKYMCSDPGQDLIKKDIKEHGITRAVVAACSPPCTSPPSARRRGRRPQPVPAADGQHPRALLLGHRRRRRRPRRPSASSAPQIHRLPFNESLEPIEVPVNPNAMVVGGGIAGIEAALKLAQAGKKVYLVEREPVDRRAHGHVRQDLPDARLRRLHPDAEDVGVGKEPNIELLAYSEVTEVERLRRQLQGQGPQEAALHRHRQVHRLRPLHRGLRRAQGAERVRPGLSKRSAAYIPFPQAVPLRATIDQKKCLTLQRGKKCKQPCVAACGARGHRLRPEGGVRRPRGRADHPGDRLRALGCHARTSATATAASTT